MLRSLFENSPGKEGKKRKRNFWLYSVGEFVLIFLGILIALQVENWNQSRQDRKLERVLPSEMRSNLQTIIPMEKTLAVNLEELRKNNGFTEDLHMTIFIYKLSIRTYERALVETIKLIADIEEELGLKPGDSK